MILEWSDAEPAHGIDEALVLGALLHIDLQDAVDDGRHLAGRERRADDLADAGQIALRAAERYLVPLAAVLVDAENADIADMMMAAGVDAARNIEFNLADVVLVIDIVEAFGDGLRDRDRFGVGERAEIAAGAADDVGQQADVRRG